jgi:hypothetical protein
MWGALSRILWFDCPPDHQFRIYIELSDQYKEMDAISNVVKRNVVAHHLKEVIDVLEQKVCECSHLALETRRVNKIVTLQGDQIASLYDLLSFQDKPVEDLAGQDNMRKPSGSVRT